MENDPLIGRQLGAYLIQAKLGEGGMARAYKAYDPRLQRDVAVKVILSQIAEQEGFRKRFEQEIKLSAQLEHPNIVRVYDVGESGNLTYLVMQYVGGGTLRDQLRSGRPLEPRRAAQYALQMARALHYAHLRGIVHRDVKPQNMLVSATNRDDLLLSDFGIAKLFSSTQEATLTTFSTESMETDPSLTNLGQIVGTAEYMAPEQVNMKSVDARTDVYALGVVLFQMLTGQVPFQSSSALGLLYQQVHTVPPSVRELNYHVPEMLAQITAKALQKAPEARFQSAEEMAQALEAALATSSSIFSAAPDDYSTQFRPSSSIRTYPPQSRPTPSAASYYGQQSIPNAKPMSDSAMRTMTAGGGSLGIPALPRARSKFPLSYIMAAIVMVLLIVFAILRPTIPGIPGGTNNPPQTTASATPFSEDFHDNQRNWTVGSRNGLTASLPSNHNYTLTVDDVNTYFPTPMAVGILPTNFTMTVKIAQNSGNMTAFYGLAFRLKQGGSKVYCYAFVIDRNGDYEVLKYNADAVTTLSELSTGQHLSAVHGGLHQSNTLVATVQGNTFSFQVNDMPVPLNGSQSIVDSSSPYSGGQLALLVAGPNTSFTVTEVNLALPQARSAISTGCALARCLTAASH